MITLSAVGLSGRIFSIKNRKLKENHYKKVRFLLIVNIIYVKEIPYNYVMMSDELC